MPSKDGLPLGLSSQQCWARSIREEETAQEKANRKYRTSIEEKESYKWITALKETINNLPPNVQLVTLGDREADIFKFLWVAETLGSFYVIRNRANRRFIAFLIIVRTGKICVYGYSRPVAYYDLFGLL